MISILNILYPRRCILCDGVLDTPTSGVCTRCKKELIYIQEPSCKKCGQPIEDEQEEYCYDCTCNAHSFAQGKSVWLYKGKMKESMYRFKDGQRREYAQFYAKEAARKYSRWILQNRIQVIVPIPIHVKKKKRRGYNQAEIFAEELGRQLCIPVDTHLLIRDIDTIPQKKLTGKERKNNLKKALKIGADSVQWKRVLLVDDIYTTGSTVDAASEVLHQYGADSVYVLSITIGKGY